MTCGLAPGTWIPLFLQYPPPNVLRNPKVINFKAAPELDHLPLFHSFHLGLTHRSLNCITWCLLSNHPPGFYFGSAILCTASKMTLWKPLSNQVMSFPGCQLPGAPPPAPATAPSLCQGPPGSGLPSTTLLSNLISSQPCPLTLLHCARSDQACCHLGLCSSGPSPWNALSLNDSRLSPHLLQIFAQYLFLRTPLLTILFKITFPCFNFLLSPNHHLAC